MFSNAYYVRQFDPKNLDQNYQNELMEIETRCFEPDIQETWESKQDLINGSDISLFAYQRGLMGGYSGEKIIGEAYTARNEAGDMGEPGNKDTVHLQEVFDRMKTEGGVYFMSFAVLPEHQGKGVGTLLLTEMILACKRAGFKVMYTHAEDGASEFLFAKYGGHFLEVRENWFDTGITHTLYRLEL